MKMNRRMSALLKHADISVPFDDRLLPRPLPVSSFTIVDGSVLLKDQYALARHVSLASFPDRTGFECFVNHVHLPFDGTNESLESCLRYAVGLQQGLARLSKDRCFQVKVSLADNDCAIRFHELRSSESWIAEDLDTYGDEALLLLTADSAA